MRTAQRVSQGQDCGKCHRGVRGRHDSFHKAEPEPFRAGFAGDLSDEEAAGLLPRLLEIYPPHRRGVGGENAGASLEAALAAP